MDWPGHINVDRFSTNSTGIFVRAKLELPASVSR